MSAVTPSVGRRRWAVLAALAASTLVLGFQLTDVVSVVVFAALTLPAGLLGDRFGRRRMLLTGLGVLLAGSLLGALAGDERAVVVARVAMGVGGALLVPLSLSVLPTLFGPSERLRAVGIVSAASALGMPLGPVLGGRLSDHFWWGSVLLVNVPLLALGIAACLFLLPDPEDAAPVGVDALSTALTAAGLGSLVYAVIQAPVRGWGDPLVLGLLGGSLVVLTALVRRERRAARPTLDLALLGDRGFLLNAGTATLVTFVLAGLLFLLPPYLQAVLGHDAFGTGLRLLPVMGGLLIAARAAQPLVDRLGSQSVVSAGLVVLAFAAFLGSRTAADSDYGYTALWLSLAGIGFGFSMVPTMDGALAVLPADRSGGGSGLLMALRQVGGAIGIALLGSLLAGVYRAGLDVTGLPSAAADTAGESVVAAHLIATETGAPALAASADAAHVQGMAVVLLVCGVAALAAALLAAALLPGVAAADAAATGGGKVGKVRHVRQIAGRSEG
ncbi:MFS transporter [Streptomyces sp. NPDC057877]|uniref:MFS transporter n=1 Tax=Streptomyces sp. NPDC057877 TaxID=3346269 RepID=UPI0036D198B2